MGGVLPGTGTHVGEGGPPQGALGKTPTKAF